MPDNSGLIRTIDKRISTLDKKIDPLRTRLNELEAQRRQCIEAKVSLGGNATVVPAQVNGRDCAQMILDWISRSPGSTAFQIQRGIAMTDYQLTVGHLNRLVSAGKLRYQDKSYSLV